MFTTDDLEIIKTALEGYILRQKQNDNADHPSFKKWLNDTENLHKRVSNEFIKRKAVSQMLNKR